MNGKEILYNAFKSKDARLDGKFFVGVSSTGIYCRPVCHAKMPKFENCTFFKTAAEAEKAGYRPCLVCRPELAPGNGYDSRANLAARVAAYIEENCSSGMSVPEIAESFGYSERQLRRIFSEEFNVSPVEYIQTCRLLLAKKLLTETELTVTDAAMTAGFGSIRQFNDVFMKKYKMTPAELKKQKRRTKNCDMNIKIGIGYRPPYRWNEILEFLGQRAIAGVEAVRDDMYFRTLAINTSDGRQLSGWISVENIPEKNLLQLTVSDSLLPALSQVISKVRTVFDTDCDTETVYEALSALNGKCGREVFKKGLRIPGGADEFEICCRAVIGQQITVKAARTLAGRFAAAFGSRTSTPFEELTLLFPAAEDVCKLKDTAKETMGQLGIIATRGECIKKIAGLCADKSLDRHMDSDKAVGILTDIRGIGSWTAGYIAMRAFGDTDVFLQTDAGIKAALKNMPESGILSAVEICRPWRSYAMIGLWNSL